MRSVAATRKIRTKVRGTFVAEAVVQSTLSRSHVPTSLPLSIRKIREIRGKNLRSPSYPLTPSLSPRRSCRTSAWGGKPNSRLYSRLKCAAS